ncbi:MAG: hypothetical protein A3C88_02965 [Candidatus Yanofskybacteria bacterium RIFCSPHIGHO2_02_FULL_50_12]|uniref:Uncharacterized protein n=1 Tax=Candidatus Yanofskybacteria bacterium RIFCSPHIGHO2_02_FULL_50_12 TaxID=1802685 RepID=A0A1F8FVZ4_9BACT|nr:MAG: hypothetical protein A3C88_02965 [Candidatus Yanofskybacteria bacterium RIFCSPHIGHO2_02_FULL_50_12]
MIKFLLFSAGALGIFFMTPIAKDLKTSAIEVVNPASAQRRVLGDLDKKIDAISETVNSKQFSSLSTSDKIKQLNNLLDNAQGSMAAAQAEAERGDLAAAISTLVRKVVPLPGDPQPTVAVCPTP